MHKLTIEYKSGRHRKKAEFEITDEQATDPIERAAVISAKSAQFDNVVNWNISQ